MASDSFDIEDETLHNTIGNVDDLLAWLHAEIKSYVLEPILEMGSGDGDFSAMVIGEGRRIHLSDKNKANRDALRLKFGKFGSQVSVHNIDFCHPEFEAVYGEIMGTFKCILAVNVSQNGYYANLALKNAKLLLKKRGRLIFLAPIYVSTYYGVNGDFEDWKEFNRKNLKKALKNDFEILKIRYLNLGSAHLNNSDLGLSVLVIVRRLDG